MTGVSPSDQDRLSRPARLLITLAAPLIRGMARLLLVSYRVQRIEGAPYLRTLIYESRRCLPCYWHQRLGVCVGYLLRSRARGLQPGLLISPLRDGGLTARVAANIEATSLRGSAIRTGARALRDLYTSIRGGVSSIIHPDGPHGPAFQAKAGSLMLAQMISAPLLPMAFSTDRCWQLGSWDRLLIPKSFARLVITIGSSATVTRGDDIHAAAERLGVTLDRLTTDADADAGARPR